ncbi:C6 and C2H2 transcription factor [Aspergillus avenaceus]|uniref:C6 and C2H2 transcription factor n=1 Tax=Aspergillus avenaceus TaxID=36643 RepID=A0A5N6U4P2_ASPAV|nr:C6 and C2H2 transcription factor [Aspergillus avenaceus]
MSPRVSYDVTDLPFECTYPKCKASDLLRRHIRNYHPQEQLPPSRTQRACRACHTRKERCDGQYPCSTCQRRGVTCSFVESESARDGDNLPGYSASGLPRWIAQDHVDLYFERFHPLWPFLHRGTFDLSKEPCILIQSTVMIALWVEGGPKARDSAMDLHHQLCSALRSQMSQWYVPKTRSLESTAHVPMATYQSVLLQIIFACFVAKDQAPLDLALRYRLQAPDYELLVALVHSCRRVNMFSYPDMVARHDPTAPLALIWVSVEETKRFGLALYKVCRMCTGPASPDGVSAKNELLTLSDLSFCMPDSDEAWNAPVGVGAEFLREIASQANVRDNRDSSNWISESAGVFQDMHVAFEWI